MGPQCPKTRAKFGVSCTRVRLTRLRLWTRYLAKILSEVGVSSAANSPTPQPTGSVYTLDDISGDFNAHTIVNLDRVFDKEQKLLQTRKDFIVLIIYTH